MAGDSPSIGADYGDESSLSSLFWSLGGRHAGDVVEIVGGNPGIEEGFNEPSPIISLGLFAGRGVGEGIEAEGGIPSLGEVVDEEKGLKLCRSPGRRVGLISAFVVVMMAVGVFPYVLVEFDSDFADHFRGEREGAPGYGHGLGGYGLREEADGGQEGGVEGDLRTHGGRNGGRTAGGCKLEGDGCWKEGRKRLLGKGSR